MFATCCMASKGHVAPRSLDMSRPELAQRNVVNAQLAERVVQVHSTVGDVWLLKRRFFSFVKL